MFFKGEKISSEDHRRRQQEIFVLFEKLWQKIILPEDAYSPGCTQLPVFF